MSSIQRQNAADAADAARQREPAERTPPKREPPAPETVDRFRSVLQQVREQPSQPQLAQGGEAETQESLLAQSARREAQAVARAEDQAGDDARGAHGALSEVVEDGARRRGDDLGTSASALPSADASLLWQAQMALRDSAPAQAPTAPAGNAQAFADLIERHVRQLATDGGTARDGEGRVLLRMSDATLPGTDLLLSRSADGWTLRADVRSRASFDAIREAAPELAKRFAERNLGTLHIDPHYHG